MHRHQTNCPNSDICQLTSPLMTFPCTHSLHISIDPRLCVESAISSNGWAVRCRLAATIELCHVLHSAPPTVTHRSPWFRSARALCAYVNLNRPINIFLERSSRHLLLVGTLQPGWNTGQVRRRVDQVNYNH